MHLRRGFLLGSALHRASKKALTEPIGMHFLTGDGGLSRGGLIFSTGTSLSRVHSPYARLRLPFSHSTTLTGSDQKTVCQWPVQAAVVTFEVATVSASVHC